MASCVHAVESATPNDNTKGLLVHLSRVVAVVWLYYISYYLLLRMHMHMRTVIISSWDYSSGVSVGSNLL